jgi:hypothetical protein
MREATSSKERAPDRNAAVGTAVAADAWEHQAEERDCEHSNLLPPSLSHTAQLRLWENFSVHSVNTICHTACPDVAFLPGRGAVLIIYAECTLLKWCATRRRKEKPRRAKDSRDLFLR